MELRVKSRKRFVQLWITLNIFFFCWNLASAVAAYISISAFVSLVCITIGITSSAVGLKIYTITAGFKKYKSIIKKTKKKHNTKLLLAKTQLSTIKVLIYRTFFDSYTSRNKLFLVNMLREYDDMKEAFINLKTSTIHQRF